MVVWLVTLIKMYKMKYVKEKNIYEIYTKSRGFEGPFIRAVFYYFFLDAVIVVFVVAMLKSNLERIPKQNIYMSSTFGENH